MFFGIFRSKRLLLSAFAGLGLILHLACGGGAKATVAGPPPLTMTVEAPGEGLVVSAPALHILGQVSQPTATVALNLKSIPVRKDGRFEMDVNLSDGANTLTFEAWTEATVRDGRGSGLLPPSAKAEARVIRTVTYQRGPLLLAVAAPQDGATFRTASIQSSGVVSEGDATLTLNGSAVTLSPSGAFSTTLTLAVGNNTLTYLATGTGQGNRTATATRVVTYNPPPPPVGPAVNLTEPIEGTHTNAAQVRVSGKVADPSANLTVNGQGTALDAQGVFTTLLSPSEGPLTITAIATNSSNMSGSDVRHIVIDRTPPRINLTKPALALVNSRTIELTGAVDDPTALLSLSTQGITLDASGAFHAFYGLSEGPNHLSFRAVDPVGNVGTLEVDTVCDSLAPVVTLETPEEGLITNLHSLNVTGRVDDPTATLLVAGKSLKPDGDGSFTTTLSPSEGAQLIVAIATDPAGNTGHAIRSILVDWTPPVLQWIAPTPPEGVRIVKSTQDVQASVSELATVALNGLNLDLKANDYALETSATAAPYLVKSTSTTPEGTVLLVLEATDRAGNASRIERRFDCGLSTPTVILESPSEGMQTTEASTVLTGHVVCSDFVKPITLTLNGNTVLLGADLRFSLPVDLNEGQNTFRLVATSAFGQKGEATHVLYRFTSPVNVHIDWPLEGLVIPQPSVEVRGRVFRPNCTVSVNGVNATVDATTLTFKALTTLVEGPDTLTALAKDAVGNQGTDQVHVTCVTKGADASYRWDLPVDGSATRIRTVHIKGQADLPGIASIRINGQPMTLSGQGQDGQFEGDLLLTNKGVNTLLLEALATNGTASSQRRTVRFVPELPRIRLVVPDSARPGETIPVQVSPEPGTALTGADLSWNGRLLARVADPYASVQAQVPADAAIGSQIPVEAIAVDDQGETVTARAWVTVYGSGALLIEAYDDRKGLPFTDKTAIALVEGTREPLTLDEHGRAALATALPRNWIKVSKNGYTPAWRSAGMLVGAVQAAVDVRLTPLASPKVVEASGFTGEFAEGALKLTLPPGAVSAPAQLSVTPLSTQGLPGLLPLGWSAVSAWWLELSGMPLALPGSASLTLASAAPALPTGAQFAWVKWDEVQHVWLVLAAGLSLDNLAALSLPSAGSFALVLADPAPQAPPMPVAESPLPAFAGQDWRDGLVASGGVEPSIMPTADAIHGAKASARFKLDFGSGDPVPSGVLVQVDVLESYTAIDQALIEPDGFSQDVAMARWVLTVEDGKPVLKSTSNTISLDLPVRMSRTFGLTELIEGRIAVGLYRDGTRLTPIGSTLIGAAGGALSREGVNLSLVAGSLAGPTLVRLAVDPGDASLLWPEVSSKGAIAKSFTVDIVGTLLSGLSLSLDALNAPDTAHPLLLQRRVVQGQRLIVAVGELKKQGSAWILVTPIGGNPILEGGSFAVLVPTQNWDWISGITLLPGDLAQPLMEKLGTKARMVRLNSKAFLNTPSGDVAVADVSIDGGFLLAVSGTPGAFAVPAFLPADSQPIAIKGSRWDLGITGSFMAPVPSTANTLRLATVPFRVDNVLPAELAEVSTGSVMEILLSTAADPATLANVKLYQESQPQAPVIQAAIKERQAPKQKKKQTRMKGNTHPSASSLSSSPSPLPTDSLNLVDIPVRRRLSLDGRILILTPEAPLATRGTFRVVTAGLASLAGEVAPAFTRRFKTSAQSPIGDVDFSRISLSYPTEAFDVTVSIPKGAVPPWSLVSVEAPLMGSFGEGVMPPERDYSFALKSSLGERLKVTVQLRDGRSTTAFIGRYVAEDGRTTLGQDGGRVEGPGGLAVVVPEGALDASVELKVEALTEPPVTPEGSLVNGEVFASALRLRASQEVEFKKPPALELPGSAIPANADTRSDPAYGGNGPLAVFRKDVKTLPDGSLDEAFVLMDTAEVRVTEGVQRVVSLGGLRLPDPAQGTIVQQQSVKLTARAANPSNKAVQELTGSSSVSPSPKASRMASYSGGFGAGAMLDIFLLGMSADVEPQYKYHSGTVYRNWNGSGRCGGGASAGCYGELAYAEVHRYRGTLGLDAARKGRLARGRMLATSDDQGRYMNVGGPMAEAIPGQSWISLFAVDPRTGETSIDPGSPIAPDLGLPWERRNHSLVITSQGGNPFDPTLTAPRIRAVMVDATGVTRTMFTVGESTTLKLSTEAGSQPVVRGRVSGSITQDFGSLPAEIPVSSTQEGTWKADILGWTAKPVQGSASLSVIVTPVGVLGASLPGKPRLLSRDPENGDKDIDPSAMIKMTFSEPVRNATVSAFSLQVNGAGVPFRVISNAREVTSNAMLVQEIWLMADQRLSLGAAVAVGVSSAILDQDGEALDNVSWSFTVRGAEEVGSLANAGTYTEMVVHKGKIYAAEVLGAGYFFDGNTYQTETGMRKQGIRVIDATDPSNPKAGPIFGLFRSWDPPTPEFVTLGLQMGPFAKSDITKLHVATGVNIGGRSRDLLLVATRPWEARELRALATIVWDEYFPAIYYIRHNSLWVFDITDDGESTEVSMGNSIPKSLMATSQGTLTENWIKGIGSAGGVLGSIRMRSGLTMWDADAWKASWDQDRGTLSDWTIRYRTSGQTGYFPDPQCLVASNGFYDPANAVPQSVTSAVITEDPNGRPVGFATMGYSAGMLAFIDGKVGEPMANATFTSGGPKGMDGRIHDMSTAVNREPANLVEVLKGAWQGNSGTEQGTLLLAATTVGTKAHFWVVKPDLSDPNNPGATQLAYAELNGRITRIQPDPAKMLVGVQAGSRAYIFDLKTLQSSSNAPVALTPIYDFAASGAWTMADGMLFDGQTAGKKLVVKNLSGPTVICQDPPWMEMGGGIRKGSGVRLSDVDVELATFQGQVLQPRVKLNQCPWLLVAEGLNVPVSPMADAVREKIISNLKLYLKPGTQTVGAKCILRIWGTDRGGNLFEGLSREDFVAGKPATVTIIQGE